MRIDVARVASLGLAVALLLAAGTTGAQAGEAREYFGEFGVLAGVSVVDSDMAGSSSWRDRSEPTLGIRTAYFFNESKWAWFVDGTYTAISTDHPMGDVTQYMGRTGLEQYFGEATKPKRWFYNIGVGWGGWSPDEESSFTRSFFSAGFGQRVAAGKRTFARWEIRNDYTMSSEGFDRQPINTIYALFGLTWGYGGDRTDTDGDGVRDRRDKCPDTPMGAIVDEVGCPLDGDGDGVYDGLDKCPDTPAGWPVDSNGCSLDSDGDGVFDALDKCPNTPRGATVDAKGCPMDSDGDGVYDGIDRCPNTPTGARVDRTGCPMDSDGDGVYDGLDKCPNTARGAVVDKDGCAVTPKAERLFDTAKALLLTGTHFGHDSANLTSDAKQVLNKVAASMNDWPDINIMINGYTDSSGSAEYNQKLSLKRAEAVKSYLVSKGVAAKRMAAKGYGESKPVTDNSTKEGRAKNRRVELKRRN